MTTIAESRYGWIRIANEARERIDLPVGTIEEAIATLRSAFGDSYLASLLPRDGDHSKRIVTARDDRPLAYWLSGTGTQCFGRSTGRDSLSGCVEGKRGISSRLNCFVCKSPIQLKCGHSQRRELLELWALIVSERVAYLAAR
jgi:hypothetical protein